MGRNISEFSNLRTGISVKYGKIELNFSSVAGGSFFFHQNLQ